ncbi:MAG: hypothetical protein OXU37_03995 [Thaumarchaeota archaeon]|nr:hypothetical protein [Nitrososphaerota archaeon]
MSSICPECGSGSSQKAAPARVAAGRMKDPAFLAMLAVNGIDRAEMERATAPNAPNRKCSSCGAGFRARLTRCVRCGSSRLARVVHRAGGQAFWGGPAGGLDEEAAYAEMARRQAAAHFGDGGAGRRVAAEILRLLDGRAESVAGWKSLQARLGFVSLPYSGAVNRPTLECAECSKRFRLRPVRCPGCGSEEIARIQYGYPVGMPGERDWVELGGCCVSPDSPGMACRACGNEFGRTEL